MAPSTEPQGGAVKASNAETTLWKLEQIPGKDYGLIASTAITAGTLILSEKALLTDETITSKDDEDSIERKLSTALNQLSLASQKAYKNLHNNHGVSDPAHPLTGIVKSNAYPMDKFGGVFQNISRINHSCRPNTVQYWNPLLEFETVYAVRPISSGEEITLSYHSGGPSTDRKEILKTNFGFDCKCEICELPEEKLAMSDERLRRALQLDSLIGDAYRCYHQPVEALASCRELLDIYDIEGVQDGRRTRLYYDAFQLCCGEGDEARARCFAKYYLEGKRLAEGQDSLNVLTMQPFLKNPGKHDSFEKVKGRWKTAKGDVPKGLGAKQFARWLWREV